MYCWQDCQTAGDLLVWGAWLADEGLWLLGGSGVFRTGSRVGERSFSRVGPCNDARIFSASASHWLLSSGYSYSRSRTLRRHLSGSRVPLFFARTAVGRNCSGLIDWLRQRGGQ